MTGNTRDANWAEGLTGNLSRLEYENGRLWERGKVILFYFKVYVCELNILDSVIGSLKKIKYDDGS